MKATLLTLMAGVVMVGLTACNGDKSGGGDQATIPGLPQGQVFSMNNGIQDNNNYCTVAADQRSMICTTVVPTVNPNSPILCSSNTIVFTDLTTMCTNLTTAMNSVVSVTNQACSNNSGRIAMQSMYARMCNGVVTNTIPPVQTLPGQIGGGGPIGNQNLRLIRCDYEGVRKNGLTRVASRVGLLSKVTPRWSFGETSRFGSLDVTYNESKDQITMAVLGVNNDTRVIQSGSAAQEVRLDVANEDDSVRVTVSCKDTSGIGNMNNRQVRGYSCKGTVNGHSVNKTISSGDLMDGSEVELARDLTLTASEGYAGLNNALITLTATNISKANSSVTSSSAMNASAQINIKDDDNKIDVVCQPQR